MHIKSTISQERMIGRKALSLLPILLLMIITSANSQQNSIRIAMAQIFCLDGDRSGNFVRIENAIIDATAQGAQLVCFPETSLFGWVNPDAHKRAYAIPGQDSDKLCELAKKYDVYLCIGLAEKQDEHLYDSVILIDNSGTILLKHRKMNLLSELMTPSYTPGTTVQAVDTPLGKIGLLICADSFKADLLTNMQNLQPDFVIIPYGWAFEEDGWPQHAEELRKTVQNAALKISAPVIGTDVVGAISHGPWTGQVYGGSSFAADKDGNILARGKDRDRDIVMVNLTIN